VTNGVPPEDLRRQYDRALDEYRFQVDLNWRRSEYFFVLNVGVLIAAATMFSSESVPRALVAVLFLIGALLAGLSILANGTQHTYYQAARSLKAEIEQKMKLKDLALTTTPGQGSSFSRFGRVGTFLRIMLIAIALVDLGGATFAAADATHPSKPRPVTAVVNLPGEEPKRWTVIVLSRDGEAVASAQVQSASTTLKIPPGKYLVSLGGRSICQKEIEVYPTPLQIFALRC
jgi:hypothetical protein